MKPHSTPSESAPARILAALLAASLFASTPAGAAETDLANIPLANSPTVTILPNIMFILDDSGSMDWNWMPDYVYNGSYCRSTGTALAACREGDPPWYANAFNGVYYNSMVNYAAPKNADGSTKATKAGTSTVSPWDKVPVDGYTIQSNGTINLVSGYPERMACKNAGDDPNGANCKSQIDAANAYSYPDSTYDNFVTRLGAPFYYTASVEWCSLQATSGPQFGKSGTCQAKKTATYKYPRYTNWSRVTITPATTSYPGPNSTTRTYAEEMNNFANWYAWYRTRMQTMKTAMSLAFADVRGTPNDADPTDKNYFHARVGFSTINNTGTADGTEFLTIGAFDSGQKSSWYTKLFATVPSGSTPLRRALVKAGRIYAGKIGTDPIQYSCQRNFALLSTDGYYNDASTDANKEDGSTDVGDQDGDTTCATIKTPSCDKLKKSNTLADIAYYYYHTDLRSAMNNNVTPTGTNTNVDDVATHQHMTSFTIGLGVDGTLIFQDGYKTSTSGDYYAITQGSKNWPDPIANTTDERIDDLWHAAVNGRGTYFSARDPESLVSGLTAALGAMKSASGSGAAAATSNLQPTAGDNYIYMANYRTVHWDGELSAYTIDLSTGAISSGAVWQAAGLLDAKIAAAGNSDTRTVYTSLTGSSALVSFTWANLNATQQAYFDNTKLSQYLDWSAADKAAATGQTMVDYLRGQHRNEDQDRTADFGTYYRLYRDREKTLGDIVHSQPIYVGKPLYSFTDSGYSSFASAQAGRAKSVYVAANDGMLHAFDTGSGQERWAYVPSLIMKNMWRLADKDYSTNHRFFLDGPIAVSDVNAGGWKTILVGALGKGGRGIYALDVTNPAAPVAMWKFSADDNSKLGYTYGLPVITKLADGTWVVVVASGYNNVPEGSDYVGADGGGHVFVLNAATGAVIRTISTGVGSVGNPSGLAHLNVKVANFQTDNTALAAYGGDLLGNLWRFDLNNGAASKVVSLGASQPIGVPPEIGEIDGKTVLFFGTGRYLGATDLGNVQTQAIYAIRDDGATTVGLGQLTAQTMSGHSVVATSVAWSTSYGWYFNLPDAGERVHLAPQLYFGTLVIASLVPVANECQPGGYSWLYMLDYRDGGSLSVVQYTSPLVGITVVRLPGGTPKIYGNPADGSVPAGVPPTLAMSPSGGGVGSGKRVMWRELLD